MPYQLYDLVVYSHGEGGRRTLLELTAGLETFVKTVNLDNNYSDATYAEPDDAPNEDTLLVTNGYNLDSGVDYLVEADPANRGNYVVFEDLTAASLSLSYGGLNGQFGRGSIAGIQIYEVPEPGTMALLGTGGLMLLRRSTRRA